MGRSTSRTDYSSGATCRLVMRGLMGRALPWLVTLATLAAFAGGAAAQSPAILRDVRVGAHPGYDRVVIKLDGPAEIAWERGPEPGAESLYLSADPIRSRVIKTKLARVGDIAVTPMRGGTRVLLAPHERRVRAYLLAKPPRLVIDVAPPATASSRPARRAGALARGRGRDHGAAGRARARSPRRSPRPKPARPGQARAGARARAAPPQAETAPEPAPADRAAGGRARASRKPPRRPRRSPGRAGSRRRRRPRAAPAPAPEVVPTESFPWPLLLAVLLGGAGLGAIALVVRARGGPPRGVPRSAPRPLDAQRCRRLAGLLGRGRAPRGRRGERPRAAPRRRGARARRARGAALASGRGAEGAARSTAPRGAAAGRESD